LIHSLREIGDYTTSDLGAVILLRLERILNVMTNLRQINLVSKPNNHSIECNESILGDFFRLFEQVDDSLYHVVSQWLLNSVPNLDQNDLHQATK
jgi:hypothetical protein